MALTKIPSSLIEQANQSITSSMIEDTLDLTSKTVSVATATAGDNDTTVASTAFVASALAALVDSSPTTLDTLNELAAALGDDPNFATTTATAIGLKAPLASPVFTGDVLVGKGAANFTVAGHEIKSSSFAGFTRDGGAPVVVNRLTSDGALIELYRGVTSVGSIGTVDGDLNVYPSAAGHKGLRFGNGYIGPTGNSTTVENGTTDLGLSTQRFKDLYLSGKIMIGTGSSAAATINAYSATVATNLFSALRVIDNTGASSYWDIGATGGTSTKLNFYHNANTSPKMTLESNGNLVVTGAVGVGYTPNSWFANRTAIQLGNSVGNVVASGDELHIGTNFYNKVGTAVDTITSTGFFSTDFAQRAGIFTWSSTAATGTAEDNVSFVERMRIDTSGNVGIAGQTNPTYKLDGGFVNQTWGWYLTDSYNAGFTYNTAERSLLIHTKSADFIDHIKFATGGSATERLRIDAYGNTFFKGSATSNQLLVGVDNSNIFLRSVGSAPFLFQNNGAGTIVSMLQNGNVGIGTTNPNGTGFDTNATVLSVNGYYRGILELGSNNNVIGDMIGGIEFRNTASTEAYVRAYRDSNGDSEMRLGAHHFNFTSGNVGIGTANPVNAKLEIESSTDQGLLIQLKNTDQDSNTYMRYKDWAGQYWDTGINWANNDYYFNYGGAFRARFTNAGGLQIDGSGADTTPTLALNSTTSTTFNHSINAFNANLVGSQNQLIVVGKEGSTKNSGYIGYKWIAGGNNGNMLTFGHWGNDNLMNLTANGNLGIGTQGPIAQLDVQSGVGSSIAMTSSHGYSQNRNWAFKTNNFGSGNWGGFSLETSTSVGTAPSVAMFGIDINGNCGIGIGGAAGATQAAAKLDVGGTIRAADGIMFGTSTGAAHTLDDYEEGTFTATLKGDSTGLLTATIAEYTKIGDTVHCRVAFINVDTTGYSGHLRVEGLPFPMKNGNLRNVCTPAMYQIGAFTADYVIGLVESSTHVNFYGVKSANTWNTVAHNAGSNRYLEFNVTYSVA